MILLNIDIPVFSVYYLFNMISVPIKKTLPTKIRKHSVFNDQYELVARLGKGKTSEVYLAR